MTVQLDFMAVLRDWPMLVTGVVWTLGLTAVAVVLGLLVAVFCAWARANGPKWLAFVVGAYVELIRNTPFIVQLFFVFFGLPAAGVRLSPVTASLMALTLNLAAYGTEIIRAGLEATPRGQIATRELSYAANVISASTFRTFESYIVATAIYLGLAWAVRRVLNWVGPRFIFGR